MINICFVCLGNICRSPTAEGVMFHLLEAQGLTSHIQVDSAGTGNYHVGEAADARAARAARHRGVILRGKAAQFVSTDFDRFDYVIAMDCNNRAHLQGLARSGADRAKVHLLRDFDPASRPESEVPDPYYGGDNGFETVLDICEAGCRGLIAHIRAERGLPG